jgi:hypothetical protein
VDYVYLHAVIRGDEPPLFSSTAFCSRVGMAQDDPVVTAKRTAAKTLDFDKIRAAEFRSP